MFTHLFNPHQPAFWRGLILSGLLLSVALILTGYFAGFIFVTLFAVLAPPLALLLILMIVPCVALLGALLWVKIEQAFENLKWQITRSLSIDSKRATNTLPMQKDVATKIILAKQDQLLLEQQKIQKIYPSPIASISATEESTEENSQENTEESVLFYTSYSDPPKKITTHDKDESAHDDQTTTPSPFHVW